MLYELQALLHNTDISLYMPVSNDLNESSRKSHLKITADDVVAISFDEADHCTPLDGTSLSNSRHLKGHSFKPDSDNEAEFFELSGVKLHEHVVESWGCIDIQKALDAFDFIVKLYIHPDLERTCVDFLNFVRDHQSQPLTTFVPVAVYGNDEVLSDSNIEFVCAEITFSAYKCTVRLLDRDMTDGYWYLTDPIEFAEMTP